MPGMHKHLACTHITLNSDDIIRSQWDPGIFGPGRMHLVLARTWPYTTQHIQALTMSLTFSSFLFTSTNTLEASTLVKHQTICWSNFTGISLVEFLLVQNLTRQYLAHPVVHQHCRTFTEVSWSCASWIFTPEHHSQWLRKQPQHNVDIVRSVKMHRLSPASQPWDPRAWSDIEILPYHPNCLFVSLLHCFLQVWPGCC